jgi:hypothetical protein
MMKTLHTCRRILRATAAGSLDTIVLRDLSANATFDIDDGELHVTTKDGLGTLTFERVR